MVVNNKTKVIEPKLSHQVRVRGKFSKGTPIVADLTAQSGFGWIDTKDLVIDHLYQRQPDKQRIISMSRNWDQDRCGAIVVNVRKDGTAAIIDGQQRYEAQMLMANTPSTMFAQIFEGLSIEEEAKLFYELDTKRRGLTQSALFQALLAANDKAAIDIKNAAAEAGLTTDPRAGNTQNNLRAFGTLLAIHRRIGRDNLARILKVAATAWPNNKYWGAGSILLGLEAFLSKYPQAKDSHLIEALSKTSPHHIENDARVLNQALSSALGQWTARVMLQLYNKGMKKNRLPEWI